MKKYLVAGVIGAIGIILGIVVKGGIGLLFAILLIILALVIAFGKIGFAGF